MAVGLDVSQSAYVVMMAAWTVGGCNECRTTASPLRSSSFHPGSHVNTSSITLDTWQAAEVHTAA